MTDNKKIKSLLLKIEQHKAAIAKHRDELRDVVFELESCMESLDVGIDEITYGMKEFNRAIDSLSEHL